jgi:DNA repair protein RadC
LKLTKDLAIRYQEQDIRSEDIMNNPGKIANFARIRLGGMNVEAMMVLFLNTQNALIEHEIVSEGTTDQVNIYPAEIARKALLYHAKSIILCHNHPGGKASPSEDDIHVTRQIRDILRAVNIFVLDHIIVSRFSVFSLRREQDNLPARARILDPLPGVNVCAEPGGEYEL